jgi:hypothetical protein
MSEEDEKSNNEEGENEDEEKEEGEGEDEENEGDEKEDEEEKENDEEGEEKEDEGEEKEDEEEEEDEEDEDKKKKKKKDNKKGKKDEENKENEEEGDKMKFPETKLSPTKEIKIDLNLNNNNNNFNNNYDNIFFNGNDITMGNIIPKKSTLQLLSEISSEMDALTAHLEKVLPPPPPPPKISVDYGLSTPLPMIPIMPLPQTYSLPPVPNYDQEDLEIKKLIKKANEMTNNSILYKNNNDINNSMSSNIKEIKTYENKACQSDDELGNSFSNNPNNDDRTQQDYYNDENNRNGNMFPYDPYKHLDYYNDLRNNNNYNGINNGNNIPPYNDNNRMKRMDEFYRGNNNNFRRRPIHYSQTELNENENRNRQPPFQRYRPGSIGQAMDILLDRK